YLLFHEYYSSSTTFKPQNHADALQNNYTAMINLIILIHYRRKKIHEFAESSNRSTILYGKFVDLQIVLCR
ncbi:MAG: hypothetical protein LBB21_02760, partial [Holosporaceae bacterium]|nr:hypothetical protein [Holosporaceae bacterium]